MPAMTAAVPPPSDTAAAKARARAAWGRVGDRLATVTPSTVGRILLGTAVFTVATAIVIGTWPTLLPFVAGGILAYAVLPVVDALDRVMPRSLAAVGTMLAALFVVGAVLALVIPPLVSGVIAVIDTIPTVDRIQATLDDLLSGLPDEAREVVDPIVVSAVAAIQDALEGAPDGLRTIVPQVLGAVLGVVGATFGLLILPAWLLTLMTDQRRTQAEIDRRLPTAVRADTWAVVRILDRAAGTYLRGFVVIAFLVGVLTYVGLGLATEIGGPAFAGQLALATFAGAVQVVPELGPVLGLLPAILLLAIDPERAAVYLAVYVAARLIVSQTAGGRLLESRLGVHPLILIPGVVVLSQLGPLWLLLSAPILAASSDLVRYLHGRMSEPPRPAGLLPGEPTPAARASAAAAATAIPPVYRPHRQGPPPIDTTARPTVTPTAPAAARPAVSR